MEQIGIHGLELNDGLTYSILEGTFTFTPARKKLNWMMNPLADGAALSGGDEDHYDGPAEMTFTVQVRPQGSTGEAQAALNAVTQKFQEARKAEGGLPLTWTPHGSSNTWTYYIQNAEWDEVNVSREGGWFSGSRQVVAHLYLKPFGYLPEQSAPLGWSDSFSWDGLTGGRWRFDTAATNLTISGDQLNIATTSERVLYLPWTTTDATVYMRGFIGATLGSGSFSIILKRADATNHLRASITAAAPGIQLIKRDGGADTTLATTTNTLTANTWYWLSASTDGDEFNASLYADTINPLSGTASSIATVTHTLTGADATQYGSGIRGNLGIRTQAGSTDWLIDQWTARDMTDIKSTEPLVDFELPDIAGQVPAEGRMVVLEGQAKSKAHFEWGLEQRSYRTDATPPLILDNTSLLSSTSGFAGSTSSSFDAYDPDGSGTNNVILSLGLSVTAPVTICSTGSQQHVGNYKVKTRVVGTEGIRLRLAWKIGDGSWARNPYSAGITANNHYQELDLGNIVVPQAQIGDQSWEGRIEAYSPESNNGFLILDFIKLIPAEAYGVARAPLQPVVATSFSARDRFNQAGGPLHGKTLDVGGTWSTSGATTDFTINATDHVAQRVAVSDTNVLSGRYAEAGTGVYGPVQAQVDILGSTAAKSSATSIEDLVRGAVFARYVDASNWLMASLQVHSTLVGGGGGSSYFHTWKVRVFKRVAGTSTQLGNMVTERPIDEWMTLVLMVDGAGIWQVYAYPMGTKQPSQPRLKGYDAILTTTLDDGKVGIYDANASALTLTRRYNNFAAFGITPDVVINASKHLEIRSYLAEREAATGGNYGRVPQYQGSRFFIPAAGDVNRVSRMAVQAHRTNVDEGLPDDNLGDALTVSAYARPRYLIPAG